MENLGKEIKRVRYPHMKKEEVEIWRRYLKIHGNRFDKYEYDVRVGKGSGWIPGLSEPYQTMAQTISKKRIDVVAYRNTAPYIIEIKPIADMEAIGQLKVYKTMYEEKKGKGSVKGLIIVALSVDMDIKITARKMGIGIVTV